MSSSYDDIYKLLVVGNPNTGKTGMTQKFTDGSFTEFHYETIGVDLKFRNIKLTNGKTIKLQIWDTAGQERFRSLSSQYYRGAMGVLFVYDITCAKSFRSIPEWVRFANKSSKPDVKFILVGNKCDLDDGDGSKRQVSTAQGEQLAAEYGMRFIETSSKTNQNIDEAFLTLAGDIYEEREKSGESQRDKLVIYDESVENGPKNYLITKCCL